MKIKFLFVKIIFCYFIIITPFILFCQNNLQLRYEDKLRINEAVKIAAQHGNSVWENWDSTPFTFLIVTEDSEYLIKYPFKPDGFIESGYDSVLQSNIYTRERKFDKRMFASFPPFDSITVIVAGLPENTGYPGNRWIITLLHEHFHQFQYSHPDYFLNVKSLDLAGNDNTGMWMLNYPFPYENDTIVNEYNNLSELAERAAFAKDEYEFNTLLKSFIDEQKKFKSMLKEKDYNYFSFQLWQEGIARYTEYKITQTIMNSYQSPEEVTKLKDYVAYNSLYKKMIKGLKEEVESVRLNKEKRVCFYSLGALIGLILDRANPNWHDLYFKKMFYLEKYF